MEETACQAIWDLPPPLPFRFCLCPLSIPRPDFFRLGVKSPPSSRILQISLQSMRLQRLSDQSERLQQAGWGVFGEVVFAKPCEEHPGTSSKTKSGTSSIAAVSSSLVPHCSYETSVKTTEWKVMFFLIHLSFFIQISSFKVSNKSKDSCIQLRRVWSAHEQIVACQNKSLSSQN